MVLQPLDSASDFQQWMLKEWCGSLSQALEAMTGAAVTITPDPGADPGDLSAPDWLWWEQTLRTAEQGPIWIGAQEESWRTIATKILEAAGIDSLAPDEVRGTYVEVLQHGVSALSTALTMLVGREIGAAASQIVGSRPDAPPVLLKIDGPLRANLVLCISPALRDALRRSPSAANSAPSSSASQEPAKSEPAVVVAPANIEVLYDVELPVSISFGRAHLPLREVLKLTSGSIVELNRTVSEPVDVVVNNCIIARAEVVVVEGNYGVKILQIISQNDRLRTVR